MIDSAEGFYKIKDHLFKRSVESLLKSKMTAHLTESEEKNMRNGYSSKTLKKT